MAIDTNEPRALSAALSQPAFATRGAGVAMHVANRHVERWAPEAGAHRVRSMRSLGFVDRMISPWIETAQRSASLRLFSQYQRDGMAERAGGDVSWVFPRPWYQDELAWMAAARQAPRPSESPAAPTMFTTRGTYVPATTSTASAASAPAFRESTALPTALYEYVAPSLSIASGPTAPAGVGYGGEAEAFRSGGAYSPLIPLAAVQAAQLMSRAVAPALAAGGATARMSPALRNVLSTMLERAAIAREETPSRVSGFAPALETPPAPRPDAAPSLSYASDEAVAASSPQAAQAMQLAQQYAQQRAQIVEVQRIAQRAAERELATRVEAARVERAAEIARTSASTSTSATPTATAAYVADAETRAVAARAAELRQTAAASARGEAAEEQRRQIEAATVAAATERARIEERIAQRLSERQRSEQQVTRARTLHEQARAEAAAHARSAVELTPTAAPASAPVAPSSAAAMPPSEVTAALAALPPELAAMFASVAGGRPDRVLRAIDELSDAMRTVELMAQGTARGETFQATRGPRLMMPAGIGGLVSAVDRAHTIGTGPAALGALPTLAPLQPTATAVPTVSATAAARSATRVPNLTFLARPDAPTRTEAGAARMAPTSTFAATMTSAPAALDHVAWADRWLARFAGASNQSLDTFSASAGHPSRLEALSSGAPGGVFVSPEFDIERDAERVRVDGNGRVIVTASPIQRAIAAAASNAPGVSTFVAPTGAASTVSAASAAPDAMRYDDNAETPDDVFAAISAAASMNRAAAALGTTPAALGASAAASATSLAAELAAGVPRVTTADIVAHSAPHAPMAGFGAGLAASPFASALRHVLPLPTTSTFDVRSLFGSSMSATYLAGLLAPAAESVDVASAALPSWATWAESAFPLTSTGAPVEREAPSFDAAYVSPEADRRPDAFDAGELTAPTSASTWASTSASAAASTLTATAAMSAMTAAPLATLRTALLSWEIAQAPFDAASPTVTAASAQPVALGAHSVEAARAMISSMSLPLLDDTYSPMASQMPADVAPAFAAPGMIAARAQSWSVAQERSSSDLALDFVAPELVLAARVYGLGPAEAAQAMRLAIAGPGPLGAMASTVDRTFVQAMAIEGDRRGNLATAYPTADAATLASLMSAPTSGAPATGGATSSAFAAPTGSVPTSFGVERRAPRGAFLWPSATVAALGLNAAAPDGEQSMSVAALELLAAQAVAELGTYAALSPMMFGGANTAGAAGAATGDAKTADDDVAPSAAARAPGMPMLAGATSAAHATPGSTPVALAEPSEQDVLDAATSMVPSARRARFEALYVALGQSAANRSTSPAARAARALALAGRGEETLTPRERAAVAWDVLPVVYAAEAGHDVDSGTASAADFASSYMPVVASRGTTSMASAAAGASSTSRGARGPGDTTYVEADLRPGLGMLSARAGEALGSYVAPEARGVSSGRSSAGGSSEASSHREVGAVLRAPTAAQELVRTGRPSGRFGGGEVEIPTWFEAAARKMLEDRSGASDGISLAELTLVTAAPSTQVAAASVGVPTSAPLQPGMGTSREGAAKSEPIDVEKIANEIYRHILTMMDAARERNGEPYL